TANTLYVAALRMPVNIDTLTMLSINVTTNSTSGSARLGLFTLENDGSIALVLDAGTVSTATNGHKQITGLTQVVTPGTTYAVAALFSENCTVTGGGSTAAEGLAFGHEVGPWSSSRPGLTK